MDDAALSTWKFSSNSVSSAGLPSLFFRAAQHPPFLSKLIIGPRRHHIMPTADDTVKRAVHCRVAKNSNADDPRERFHSLPDEFTSMFVVRSSQRILSTEISSSQTSIDAVHHLNLPIRQYIPPICSCHAGHLTVTQSTNIYLIPSFLEPAAPRDCRQPTAGPRCHRCQMPGPAPDARPVNQRLAPDARAPDARPPQMPGPRCPTRDPRCLSAPDALAPDAFVTCCTTLDRSLESSPIAPSIEVVRVRYLSLRRHSHSEFQYANLFFDHDPRISRPKWQEFPK